MKIDVYFFGLFFLVFWSAYKKIYRKEYFRTAAAENISDSWSNQSDKRYSTGRYFNFFLWNIYSVSKSDEFFFFCWLKFAMISHTQKCRSSPNWTTSNALKWRLTVYEWKEKPNSRLFFLTKCRLDCVRVHARACVCVCVYVALALDFHMHIGSMCWFCRVAIDYTKVKSPPDTKLSFHISYGFSEPPTESLQTAKRP